MEDQAVVDAKGKEILDLPPGFRFHPTDEEIITHYLTQKVMNSRFSASAFGEVDLNKCEPWDLPKKAKMGEKEWYFFCQRDRKYPTGMRTNRATEAGYWKATGKDKEIFKGKGCLVGMKKTLVFYKGRAPKGEKTNWIMHEYRLEGKFSYYNLPKGEKDEWVVCRVFHKNTTIMKKPIPELLRTNSFGDDFLDYSSFPTLLDTPPYTSTSDHPNSSFLVGEGDEEFNVTSSSRSADGNYLSSHGFPNILQPPPNTGYQSGMSVHQPQIIPLQNPLFPYQSSPNSARLYQGRSVTRFGGNDQAILKASASKENTRQCKVEQFASNQSMVPLSQDTGLSIDMNNEISSRIEIESIKSHEDMEDLECLWNY
ncbi:hypothetical protein SLEP1_g19289 [Rubroshorea leprosula]|nr:hypothetical protein SLEP1_g19289 [Rubroshorea leprosula]